MENLVCTFTTYSRPLNGYKVGHNQQDEYLVFRVLPQSFCPAIETFIENFFVNFTRVIEAIFFSDYRRK